MVLALSVIGAFLVWVSRSVDSEDIRRQAEIAGYALREIRGNLAHNQESSTFWDEAVQRTAAGDEEWIDGNLGSWMHTFFGIDEAYVVDGQDLPIYSFAEKELKPPLFFESRRDLFRPYLQRLRSSLAAGETPPEESREQSIGITDYTYVGGRPAVISLKPILSESGRLAPPLEAIRVHVAVQYLEGAIVDTVAESGKA